jgi:dimethylaniline monooxygenase (N-oxide forming)
MNMRICVIGAGISGLVSAKTFLESGYEVTVFEKQKGLGGVWEKSRTYPGLTTQNTRDTYCFSDYPMPESYPEFPTAQNIRDYLHSYATHFGVFNRIRFETEIVNVIREDADRARWIVTFRFLDVRSGVIKEENQEFDFVLICNGVFSIPKIPAMDGKEEFIASGGEVLHSSQVNDFSIIDGKRVVVIGFGKSAVDIATLAAERALVCNLVFRRALWKIPKRFFNKISYKDLLLTRFSEIWLQHRKPRGIEKFLHRVGKPLVWAFWRINEMIVRSHFPLARCGMLPDIPMNKSLTCTANIAPDNFYEYIKLGKIQTNKTGIARFTPDGIELTNGKILSADVVIFGTGFTQNLSFLAEKYRNMVMDEAGNFHLYRHLIHADIPNLGFIGYNSSMFCMLTSEVASWWMVEYIKGNLALPQSKDIYREINTDFRWEQRHLAADLPVGICVVPFNFHHLEDLLEDMGLLSSKSKPVQGMMECIDPLAYQELRQKLLSRKPQLTTNT